MSLTRTHLFHTRNQHFQFEIKQSYFIWFSLSKRASFLSFPFMISDVAGNLNLIDRRQQQYNKRWGASALLADRRGYRSKRPLVELKSKHGHEKEMWYESLSCFLLPSWTGKSWKFEYKMTSHWRHTVPEGWHSTTSHNGTVGFVSALSNNNLITLKGFVNQRLWQQLLDPSAENGHHSLTTRLQGHWLDCQYCTYKSRNSLTKCYRHLSNKTKQLQVFVIWPVICIVIVYFAVTVRGSFMPRAAL